jgi:type VI secretion system protein ImpG
MRDELFHFYERELAFLRRSGAEFAKQYPKVAGRLLLEDTKCDDPHVERLLEGFAFLAARVQLRIHDDFPEFSEALLDVAYPQFTRPIPSMSLVEFHLDPEQGKLTTGYPIPRATSLYSRPVAGAACRFQTCYDTALWPMSVSAARWSTPHEQSPPVRAPDAVAALRLELTCAPEVTFKSLSSERLRFHLRAEPALASTLYELLCNNCLRILVRDPSDPRREPRVLPASTLRPVGFDADEGILPVPRRAFVGYRMLQEYFTFPDKFFFLEIADFAAVREACPGSRAELILLISPFERADRADALRNGVTAETLRLGCTPVVNLFPHASEPIQLNQRKAEYVIIPDARRRTTTGIYSVEEVVATSPGSEDLLRFEPFHSFHHGVERDRPTLYWAARRRPAGWRQDKTDVFLSFLDLSSRTVFPESDAVTARLLCHNEDLPSRLPFGNPKGDFEMQGGGPVQKIVALSKPTEPIQPALGRPQLWRLISQLSLNYFSLAEGGATGLQELLRLHNFSESPAAEQQIRGITSVTGRPCHAGIDSEHGRAFARGQRVEIEFDEDQFAGSSVYLLASVLERFLGLYVSLNSFCILDARTRQRKDKLREWPPRSGWKALL